MARCRAPAAWKHRGRCVFRVRATTWRRRGAPPRGRRGHEIRVEPRGARRRARIEVGTSWARKECSRKKEKSATRNAGASRCSRPEQLGGTNRRHLRLPARGGLAQCCRRHTSRVFTLRPRGNPTHCRAPQAAPESLYYNLSVGMRRKSRDCIARGSRPTLQRRRSAASVSCIVTSFKGPVGGCAGAHLRRVRACSSRARSPRPAVPDPACADAAVHWPCSARP